MAPPDEETPLVKPKIVRKSAPARGRDYHSLLEVFKNTNKKKETEFRQAYLSFQAFWR